MSPEKAEKLFSLMKKHGVEYFKHDDLEIKMSIIDKKETIDKISISPQEKNKKKSPSPQAIPPVEMKIPHHVNEVQNLLRLNDNDLVEKLFPEAN